MKAHSIKTDNHSVKNKIALRKHGVKNLKKINVLDLFAGNNILWSNFETEKYFGIEKEKNKGKNLTADNLKVIPNLDLSKFNVIDCDSYGFPINQIEMIFNNKTLKKGTVIFYTAIGNKLSSLPKSVLKEYNLQKIYKKSKVLLNGKSHELFYGFLYKKGIRTVFEYEEKSKTFTKKYGYFIV